MKSPPPSLAQPRPKGFGGAGARAAHLSDCVGGPSGTADVVGSSVSVACAQSAAVGVDAAPRVLVRASNGRPRGLPVGSRGSRLKTAAYMKGETR